MKKLKRRIVIDQYTTISSVWAVPDRFRPGHTDAVILAHGAGNDMTSPFLSFVHESLAAQGWLTIKFNFPYKEQGKAAPDAPATLERVFKAVLMVVQQSRLTPRHVFIGGKSMGGRIASHLAAQGEDVAGLVLLGYPLHPPSRPTQRRVAHLKEIACPILFISGTRDTFCQTTLLKQTLKRLGSLATLHLIEGADHSFIVPKQLGRTTKDVWCEITSVAATWLKQVVSERSATPS